MSEEIEEKQSGLGYYEVEVTFQEQATVTLVAPSEEAAVELVNQQYQGKLEEFNITSVTFLRPVEKAEGSLVQ